MSRRNPGNGFTMDLENEGRRPEGRIPGTIIRVSLDRSIFIGTKPVIFLPVYHNPFIFQQSSFAGPGNSIRRFHRETDYFLSFWVNDICIQFSLYHVRFFIRLCSGSDETAKKNGTPPRN